MIQVDHLCYHYKGGRPILRDVSFELDSGHFLAVLGNNGVGKSTLLKCINRILTATAAAAASTARICSRCPTGRSQSAWPSSHSTCPTRR